MFDCDNKQCPYHPENNVALSWDELKQMEGKPVWVTIGLLRSRWFLIEEFEKDRMIVVGKNTERVPLHKNDIWANGWQAYRKER